MQWSIRLAFVVMAASLFAAGTGQAQQAPITMLIGNVTANDTQAAINDKFAELVTKSSGGRISASARHGGALGNSLQLLASLQAGAVHGMINPTFVMSGPVPEVSLLDLPFLVTNANPAKITAFANQSKAAAKMVELYKRIRSTVQLGDLYRLLSPREGDVTRYRTRMPKRPHRMRQASKSTER